WIGGTRHEGATGGHRTLALERRANLRGDRDRHPPVGPTADRVELCDLRERAAGGLGVGRVRGERDLPRGPAGVRGWQAEAAHLRDRRRAGLGGRAALRRRDRRAAGAVGLKSLIERLVELASSDERGVLLTFVDGAG